MSHYETIGVHETATAEEIKKAYRERSKELHPDANDGDDKGFAKLAKAYKVLSDPEKRKKYDETGIDTENNEAEQVNSIMAGLTLAFLEHAPSVKTESLTDFVKKQVKEQLGNAKSAVTKLEKEIDRAENAKNRIVRKELGHNLILSVFENKISEARTNIVSTTKLFCYLAKYWKKSSPIPTWWMRKKNKTIGMFLLKHDCRGIYEKPINLLYV